MSAPIIGITSYARDGEVGYALPAEYVEAVRRAGGTPILLPPGDGEAARWLEVVDGVILSGGGDLDPSHYGSDPHDEVYMVDQERDRCELELARQVAERGVPTLGICRGTQLLNVALGGSLFLHLPDEFGESVLHRRPPRQPNAHSIELEPDSRLARLLGWHQIEAASWHHQAIRQVAPGLEAVARAPDGVLEAVEKPDHPWLFAVQWHPELSAATDVIQQRLFDALVEAAKQAAEENR